MKTKTHKKLNITLPLDVYDWAVKKQKEEQKKTRLGKVHFSNIIADAVAEMKQREDAERLLLNERGNDRLQPHSGPTIMNPRKTSAGGSGIPKTVTYRKAGRAGK